MVFAERFQRRQRNQGAGGDAQRHAPARRPYQAAFRRAPCRAFANALALESDR
jgi:hypothetical protein